MIVTIDKAFAENGWGHVGMFIQNICLSTVERGMELAFKNLGQYIQNC